MRSRCPQCGQEVGVVHVDGGRQIDIDLDSPASSGARLAVWVEAGGGEGDGDHAGRFLPSGSLHYRHVCPAVT